MFQENLKSYKNQDDSSHDLSLLFIPCSEEVTYVHSYNGYNKGGYTYYSRC